MTALPAGKLITVAGIDGAGKSTLSAYLDSLNAIVYRRDQAVGAACAPGRDRRRVQADRPLLALSIRAGGPGAGWRASRR
jgi:hypothetical protein